MNKRGIDLGGEFEALCAEAGSAAVASDKARRLPDALVAEMARQHLFSMHVPKAIGGVELSLPAAVARIQALAEANAASAWVAMIGTTTSLGAAFMEQERARDIFGGASVTCGIFAPSGRAERDGTDYILTGRWSWASGSSHAEHIGLGCLVAPEAEGERPENRMFMVPRDAVIFHDTWHSLGLCATQSGDVEVSGVRVSGGDCFSAAGGEAWVEGSLYRLPFFGFLASGVAAVALGNARAALDDFMGFAAGKRAADAKRNLAETSRVQGGLARAEALWRSLDAHFWEAIFEIWSVCESGVVPDLKARAGLRLATTRAARQSAEVVRLVHELSGGTSVFKGNRIERALRDAQTMTQHALVSEAIFDMSGRALLDIPNPGMML